jgi:hypothetical protein
MLYQVGLAVRGLLRLPGTTFPVLQEQVLAERSAKEGLAASLREAQQQAQRAESEVRAFRQVSRNM